MIVIGYSNTWNEWTVSEVLEEMLDFRSYSYGGRPATLDDVEVVTTRYYDEDWVEEGGTDYRYLIHDGMSLPEAFGIGYRRIMEYIEEQNSEWEDDKYAEGNEW